MFEQLLAERSITLSEKQLEQFALYYRELTEWNQKMNLTAITEEEQVYVKHFYDSVSLSFFHPLDSVTSVADIGSGAGFPSIPLKICFPHLRVTIIDSLKKRIGFLENLVEVLQLDHVTCVHGRAEDVAKLKQHREQYDLVTARAVARLNILSEFCLPFVRLSGHFIAMKGSDAQAEIVEAEYAIRELGGKILSDHAFQLPMEHSDRHIIVVEKVKATPAKYPRKAGTPVKEPLLKK